MTHTNQINAEGIPNICLKELKSLVSNPSFDSLQGLRDEGGRISALIVDGLGAKYNQAVLDLIENGPDCMNQLPETVIHELQMTDESNRMTYATMEGKFPDCFGLKTLSATFDEIDQAISSVISMAKGASADMSMMYENNGDRVSIHQALKKEHIHVYDRSVSSSSYIVPFHIDNGLYLILTPFPGHGLRVKTSNNKVVSLDDLELGSAIVLFGRGVTEWLLQNDPDTMEQFYAAPHAVPTRNDETPRTVYARMKVAQPTAIPLRLSGKDHPSQLRTFGEIFMDVGQKNLPTSSYNDLCPSTNSLKEIESWAGIKMNECDEGEAFCWMACLPLPSECPHEEEAVCHNSTNEPCFDDSMDPSCHWDCK